MNIPDAAMESLDFELRNAEASCRDAAAFRAQIETRRSVRHFRSDPIALQAVEDCIAAAATAPSGANKQPWTFVLVTDPELKGRIRNAAELEERAFYETRASQRWLQDLEPLGTGPDKPFLEEAPALIAVFAQRSGEDREERHYYVQESVGIAVGILLAALHLAGFATLTHTPSPMAFLRDLLGRPENERPYLLIPVGLPAEDCEVPAIERKSLDEVLIRR
jgi:nitroreductase